MSESDSWCVCVWVCVHVCVCMHMHLCIYMFVYMYYYIYIYKHNPPPPSPHIKQQQARQEALRHKDLQSSKVISPEITTQTCCYLWHTGLRTLGMVVGGEGEGGGDGYIHKFCSRMDF